MLTQNNSSTIYVSQEYGDDNYTGTSAKVGEYGAGPFRTLERAMYVILCMRASGLRHNISIKIIGDYCMNNTLKFGFSENTCYLFGGHHNMSNVTLEGYDKNARVIGGKILKGFKKDVFNGKECISLYIPEVKEGKWKFTDLYVNGKRAESTKYPKNGTLKAVATEMGEKKELFDGVSFIAPAIWTDHPPFAEIFPVFTDAAKRIFDLDFSIAPGGIRVEFDETLAENAYRLDSREGLVLTASAKEGLLYALATAIHAIKLRF